MSVELDLVPLLRGARPACRPTGVCFTYNKLFINYLPRSLKSPESQEVIFLHGVITIPPRNAGARNLMKPLKACGILNC